MEWLVGVLMQNWDLRKRTSSVKVYSRLLVAVGQSVSSIATSWRNTRFTSARIETLQSNRSFTSTVAKPLQVESFKNNQRNKWDRSSSWSYKTAYMNRGTRFWQSTTKVWKVTKTWWKETGFAHQTLPAVGLVIRNCNYLWQRLQQWKCWPRQSQIGH